jgi:hypothetical protein
VKKTNPFGSHFCPCPQGTDVAGNPVQSTDWIFSHISSLWMRTEMVLEILVFSLFNYLTWLIVWESFIMIMIIMQLQLVKNITYFCSKIIVCYLCSHGCSRGFETDWILFISQVEDLRLSVSNWFHAVIIDSSMCWLCEAPLLVHNFVGFIYLTFMYKIVLALIPLLVINGLQMHSVNLYWFILMSLIRSFRSWKKVLCLELRFVLLLLIIQLIFLFSIHL